MERLGFVERMKRAKSPYAGKPRTKMPFKQKMARLGFAKSV
jgi:hypothetical protein